HRSPPKDSLLENHVLVHAPTGLFARCCRWTAQDASQPITLPLSWTLATLLPQYRRPSTQGWFTSQEAAKRGDYSVFHTSRFPQAFPRMNGIFLPVIVPGVTLPWVLRGTAMPPNLPEDSEASRNTNSARRNQIRCAGPLRGYRIFPGG